MTTCGPAEFPVLQTQRQRHATRSNRPYHVCSVCGLTVAPRNSRAHNKACARRKRNDPALWRLWWCDMHDVSDEKRDRLLGPKHLAELRKRGYLGLAEGSADGI